MNDEKLNLLMEVYGRHLTECVRTMPDIYAYPIENVPVVVERMRAAIKKDSYNVETPAFRRSCKELGIKYTRKAIGEFLK